MEITKYLRRTQQTDGDGEKRRDSGTAGNEGTEMISNVSGHVSNTVELPVWRIITLGEDRVVAHTCYRNIEYRYCPDSGRVFNDQGLESGLPGPDIGIVEELKRKISFLKVPEYSTGTLKILKEYPGIRYNTQTGQYVSTRDGRLILGFRKPRLSSTEGIVS